MTIDYLAEVVCVLVAGYIFLVWLLRIAARTLRAYSVFVRSLPYIISIPVFVMFPLTIVVFLVARLFPASAAASNRT